MVERFAMGDDEEILMVGNDEELDLTNSHLPSLNDIPLKSSLKVSVSTTIRRVIMFVACDFNHRIIICVLLCPAVSRSDCESTKADRTQSSQSTAPYVALPATKLAVLRARNRKFAVCPVPLSPGAPRQSIHRNP